jgi:hypothetical protein
VLYQLSYIGSLSLPLSPSGCITSLRRTQVFNPKRAKTASVATRIRVSVNVVSARTAKAAYATSAITNRFTTNLIFQTWCTGKDSNLRTSLGGADLQSAGFNHSPTCAEINKPTRHSNQRHPRFQLLDFARDFGARLTRRASASTLGSESARKNLSAPTTHPENSLMERRWKKLSAALQIFKNPKPCRLASSFATLRISRYAQDLGCGLMPANASIWSWRRDLNP